MFTGEPSQTLEENKHHQNTDKTEKEKKNVTIGKDIIKTQKFQCETLIRTKPNDTRTGDTFSRTHLAHSRW